jgi:hypothetical protein
VARFVAHGVRLSCNFKKRVKVKPSNLARISFGRSQLSNVSGAVDEEDLPRHAWSYLHVHAVKP